MRNVLAATVLAAVTVVALACGGSSTNAGSGGSSASSTTATGSSSSTGSGGTSSSGSGGAAAMPGVDATVTAFDKTFLYFGGGDNFRDVDADATFPATGAYSSIILHLALTCPGGKCDPWDRYGTLGLVTTKGATPDKDVVVELARFITPYGVGASWDYDVTDLRPLLTGAVTLHAFIDTWVGTKTSGGWALTTSFEMKGGVPAKLPIAVVPVFLPVDFAYGDPAKPTSMSVPPADLTLPAASSYALRTFITGHGQGNLSNCAEFCPKNHTLTVGTTAHKQKIWRTDCATTAAPGQQGSYQYSRAGWCPGADVKSWDVDITADVSGGKATIAYDVDSYVNTCRPDAMTCAGCSLGTGCAYDDGNHTEPNYRLSTLLIAFQ